MTGSTDMPITDIEIAGLCVRLHHSDPWLKRQCRDFLAKEGSEISLEISVSKEEIEAQQKETPDYAIGYCESICLYRALVKRLPAFDSLMFHSCAIEIDGKAYAFCGRSGAGKSTHAELWVNYFDAKYINGDKPIFKKESGGFLACGSPWSGKEPHRKRPVSVPLCGLCFIEQSKENRIVPLNRKDAAKMLLGQVVLPEDPEALFQTMALVDELSKTVPMFVLSCDISKEAATLSFETMTKGDEK